MTTNPDDWDTICEAASSVRDLIEADVHHGVYEGVTRIKSWSTIVDYVHQNEYLWTVAEQFLPTDYADPDGWMLRIFDEVEFVLNDHPIIIRQEEAR